MPPKVDLEIVEERLKAYFAGQKINNLHFNLGYYAAKTTEVMKLIESLINKEKIDQEQILAQTLCTKNLECLEKCLISFSKAHSAILMLYKIGDSAEKRIRIARKSKIETEKQKDGSVKYTNIASHCRYASKAPNHVFLNGLSGVFTTALVKLLHDHGFRTVEFENHTRVSRSLKNFLDMINFCIQKKIKLIVNYENILKYGITANLILSIFSEVDRQSKYTRAGVNFCKKILKSLKNPQDEDEEALQSMIFMVGAAKFIDKLSELVRDSSEAEKALELVEEIKEEISFIL